MRLIMMCLAMLLLCAGVGRAADTVEEPGSCKVCGMDRNVFSRSRMLIIYADGSSVGVCSIRCAAEEIHKTGAQQIASLMVADFTTRKLIDAKSAFWVMGGAKRGVMSPVAKWAFAGKEGALDFIEEYGGETATFEQVMQAAAEEVSAAAEQERAVQQEMLRELE